MGLFNIFFGPSKSIPAWDIIKDSQEVYPDNSITLFTLVTKSGVPGTGWVDMAYKKYPYKKQCSYNLLIKVDLSDSVADKNPDLDMGTIEDFFTNELRKICVSHMVARLVTDEGMNIEMYLETDEIAKEHLQYLSANPARQFSFTFELAKDPWWLATRGLMKM